MNTWETMTALAECLCTQIKEAGLPEPCFCGIVPGNEVALEYAGLCGTKCGMAWVKLISAYPAKSIGVPDISEGNCGSGRGFDLEVGIVRCVPNGRANGAGPTPEQLLESASLQMLDMDVMFRTFYCCPEIATKDMIVGGYEPLGPEGLVVGGTIVAQFMVM